MTEPREEHPRVVVPATVRGLVRGAELAGEGSLGVGSHELEIRVQDGGVHARAEPPRPRTLRFPFHLVEGVRYRDGELSLYLAGGDVLELSGTPALAAATEELISQASALAEVTRPLRALGSHRANPGADHVRFFAPFLGARRRAERATALHGRLDAFAAVALRRAVAEALRELAVTRFPESAPERRALEAELSELAEPLAASVDALEAMATAVRRSDEETRLIAWRGWAAAVRDLFACADRSWMAIAPVLAAAGSEPPARWWRRVLVPVAGGGQERRRRGR